MQDLSTIDSRIAKALNDFGDNPSIQNMKTLAWEYKNLLSYYSNNYDEFSFLECLNCINALGYRDSFFEVGVAKILINTLFSNRDAVRSLVMDHFFDYIIGIHPVKDSKFHRSLLFAFTLNSRNWISYPDFCEWWGFSHFVDSDFASVDNNFALGSSAYLAYSRALLKCSISPLTLAFWADFARRMSSGVFSIYANLQIAEFLTRIRFSRATILRVLRPLVVQKFRKPWIWLTVADVFDNAELQYKACLLFALHCTENVQNSRNNVVFFRLAQYFKAVSDTENCKYFINKLWALNVYHDEIESDFHNYVDSIPHIFIADADFDYQQICHDIFAGISNVDTELWTNLSGEIANLIL